jgi:phosphatidylinositol alpha-mannosyltransferase
MQYKPFRKIALVTPYYYPLFGGVQEYVYHLKKEYKKLGYYTRVITGHFGRKKSKDEDEVLRFGKGFPITINGSTGRIILMSGRNRVKQMLAKYNFDIIHFQEPFVPFLSHHILKDSKAVNIATFHANFNSNLYYRLGTRFLTPLWDKLNGKIAVSPSAEKSVARYFKGKVAIIPNGVDTQRFNPKNPEIRKYDDGKTNILFTGRLEKRKGLNYLLLAYSKLKHKYPETRLIVVGRGPLLHALQKYVRSKHLHDVHFEGFVPVKDLPNYYSTADIYCSPALFGESFGIVLLEAMANAVPVVAFNISGYNDVVSNMDDGLLAIPRDAHDLQEKLELLIKKPELRQELGSRGLAKARRFTWEKIARQNLAFYSQIWEKQHSNRGGN